jgi:sorting nexin-1/2
VKQGEGVSAFVSYKVRSKTTLSQYKRQQNEVVRRFRDFVWLHDKLAENNKGIIIPPLPEKNAVQKFQMATDFIEQRRKALVVYLLRIAAHPALKNSAELQLFLEGAEDEWGLEMARAQVQATNAKEKLTGALGWFKSLQHSATNLVQGKTDDALEDAEYLKMREYINQLETHLGEAQRQATRLVRKELELGAAIAEFGQAVDKLGRLEDGSLQEAFSQLSSKAQLLSAAARDRVEALCLKFEAPMKESVRYVRSVQAVVADRAAALSGLQQAKNDLDARKVKLNKLRATPGTKEEAIMVAERDLNAADQQVKNAKIAYEAIVARMTEELNRFQKDRSSELNIMLRNFAINQAQLASENAKAWGSFLQFLQGMQQQQSVTAATAAAGVVTGPPAAASGSLI